MTGAWWSSDCLHDLRAKVGPVRGSEQKFPFGFDRFRKLRRGEDESCFCLFFFSGRMGMTVPDVQPIGVIIIILFRGAE